MRIFIEKRPPRELRVHGHTHRLWLDSYFQDLTADDLKNLKAAVDAALQAKK